MSSISLQSVHQYLYKADIDGNGGVDQPEAARAAISLLGQSQPASTQLGLFFATLAQGGVMNDGLFPDFNQDGVVNAAELSFLAGADGRPFDLSSGDFQTTFGNQATGGNGVNIDHLTYLAEQNSPKFAANDIGFWNGVNNLLYTDPTGNAPQPGRPVGGGSVGQHPLFGILYSITSALQQLLSLLQGGF